MSIIKIWQLKSVAGQLSDRPKIFARQNKNLPVLSDSPAVFVKTGILQHLSDSDLDLHCFLCPNTSGKYNKIKYNYKRNAKVSISLYKTGAMRK